MSARLFSRTSGTCEGPLTDLGSLGGYLGINTTDLKPIGMPMADTLQPKTFLERRIPAEKPYLLSFRVGMANKICQISTSFVPEADADYQAGIGLDMKECRMHFTKLTTDATGTVTANVITAARMEECPKLPNQ